MVEGSVSGQGLGRMGECRTAGFRPSDVIGSWLVDAVALGQERVPVHRAEQRPDGHGPDVRPFLAQLLRTVPDLDEPAELLVAGAAVVRFRYGNRPSVTLPGLPQTGQRPELLGRERHPHG